MVADWQYTNQFFEEGRDHYASGGTIKDCPYNYLEVDQTNLKLVQNELYRQKEWLEGFRNAHDLQNSSSNLLRA